MRRIRIVPAINAAALLGVALSVPMLAWADESEHDHAHEHGNSTAAAASAKQSEQHQHNENCDHGGSPWERASVGRTLRTDANALIAVWVGIGAYTLLIRRQGRNTGGELEATQ